MKATRFLITPLTLLVFFTSIACARELGWKGAGKGGAVAAGKSPAVAIGLAILERGGNAADSAAATLLALSVTDYGSFALGAEAAMIVHDAKSGQTKVLCGIGPAPRSQAAMDFYYREGIKNGTLPAAALPGALSMIMKLLQEYGTMTFEQVVTPTIGLIEKGKPPQIKNLAATLRKMIESERQAQGTREAKIQAARDRFYRGDIAEALAAFYAEHGGWFNRFELAKFETLIEDPVTFDYHGYRVCKCGPWTQGPVLLQTLALLARADLKKSGPLSADTIHTCIEALKLALADRDKYYADPLFVRVPLPALLSPEYSALRYALIDPAKASVAIRPGDPVHMKPLSTPFEYEPWISGTTTCCVADRAGNMIAATPSGNPPYMVCEELGIAHANRLTSLNTNPRHPNRIEPGKRPRITLTPTMVLKDGKPVLAISVAGGDLQDQTTLNLLLDFIDFGMLPERAVQTPRFATMMHEDSFSSKPDRKETMGKPTLTLNRGIAPAVRQELQRRGHELKITSGTLAAPVMIYRNPANGMIYAAGDPKARRHAGAIK